MNNGLDNVLNVEYMSFFFIGVAFTALIQNMFINLQNKKERRLNERQKLYFSMIDIISRSAASNGRHKDTLAEWTSARMKARIILSDKVVDCIHNLELAISDDDNLKIFNAEGILIKEMAKDLGIKNDI